MSILLLNRRREIHGPKGEGILVVLEPPTHGPAPLAKIVVQPGSFGFGFGSGLGSSSGQRPRYRRRPCLMGLDARFHGHYCRMYFLKEDGLYSARTRDEHGDPVRLLFAIEGSMPRFPAEGETLAGFAQSVFNSPLSETTQADSSEPIVQPESLDSPAVLTTPYPERSNTAQAKSDLRLAWIIRDRLVKQALRQGCQASAELIRSVRDPRWFLQNEDKSLDQLGWPTASQVDFAWIARDRFHHQIVPSPLPTTFPSSSSTPSSFSAPDDTFEIILDPEWVSSSTEDKSNSGCVES